MAKRRKNKKNKQGPPGELIKSPAVHFEIEEDFEKLLPEYLSGLKPKETELQTIKKKKNEEHQSVEIDLHGLSLEAAKQSIDDFFHDFISFPPKADLKLTIITGKGRRSRDARPVLALEIPEYVLRKYRNYIVSHGNLPGELLLNDLPFKGYFSLVLRFQ